jgi:peptidoglycan/xylan/chitin deacetylase (PgdA/CDA1 family)
MRGGAVYHDILTSIADGLQAHGIEAIGFVNEQKLYDGDSLVAERVALLERWLAAGHELGNHGYRHLDLHTTPLATYLADIESGGVVTTELLERRGQSLEYYRHPMLHTGRSLEVRDAVTAHLADRGLRVAPVTIDNHEWIFARAYERARVCEDTARAQEVAVLYLAYMDTVTGYYEAQSRAIVGREIPQVLLLHANQLNADHLDELLTVYRNRGYTFIGLDRALRDPAYSRTDTYTGPAGITWLHRWALTEGKRGAFFRGEPTVPEMVEALYGEEGCD